MTDTEARSLLLQLESVLDDERQALVRGELDRLSGLLDRKQSLMRAIGGNDFADHAGLDAIKHKISRNQQLLNGALDGLRAVVERIADMRRARNNLETYDRTGNRTRVDTADRQTVERRA